MCWLQCRALHIIKWCHHQLFQIIISIPELKKYIFIFGCAGSLLLCMGFSRVWAQLLWHTGFSCSEACGIFPDERLNLCPLHWQVDSYPMHHRGSPRNFLIFFIQLMLKVKFSEVHSVEKKHLSLNVSINSFKVKNWRWSICFVGLIHILNFDETVSCFPGGPVAKTPCFQCRGPGFDP